MERIEEQYRGYKISYQKIPLTGGEFIVNVGSEDPNLMLRLEYDNRVVSGRNKIDAINKAKYIIDQLSG